MLCVPRFIIHLTSKRMQRISLEIPIPTHRTREGLLAPYPFHLQKQCPNTSHPRLGLGALL